MPRIHLSELFIIAFYGAIPVGLVLLGAWKALGKAGYPGWWALLLLVPFLNLAGLLVFGLADWPVLRRVRALEAQAVQAWDRPPPL